MSNFDKDWMNNKVELLGMNKMQRYDLDYDVDTDSIVNFTEDNGEWCKYSDVEKLELRVSHLQETLDGIWQDNTGSCSSIKQYLRARSLEEKRLFDKELTNGN